MKITVRTPADIVENLRELASEDQMLSYTLERLALQSPSNRHRVLDAFRSRKRGRPNRSAGRNAMWAVVECEIQDHRPQVEKALGKNVVSERDIIVWLLETRDWGAPILRVQEEGIVFRALTKSGKSAVKRVQDGLADYRRGKRRAESERTMKAQRIAELLEQERTLKVQEDEIAELRAQLKVLEGVAQEK